MELLVHTFDYRFHLIVVSVGSGWVMSVGTGFVLGGSIVGIALVASVGRCRVGGISGYNRVDDFSGYRVGDISGYRVNGISVFRMSDVIEFRVVDVSGVGWLMSLGTG